MASNATAETNLPTKTGPTQPHGSTPDAGQTATSLTPANDRSKDVESRLRASLKGSLATCLEPIHTDGGSELFGADPKLSGFRIVAACSDREALERAIRAHDSALQPASRKDLATALARLHSLVAKKDEGADAARLQVAAYAEQLAAYPADIALAVLEDWPKRSRWWPAWFDLQSALDAATLERKTRRAALIRLRHFRQVDPEEPAERADADYVAGRNKELKQIFAGRDAAE